MESYTRQSFVLDRLRSDADLPRLFFFSNYHQPWQTSTFESNILYNIIYSLIYINFIIYSIIDDVPISSRSEIISLELTRTLRERETTVSKRWDFGNWTSFDRGWLQTFCSSVEWRNEQERTWPLPLCFQAEFQSPLCSLSRQPIHYWCLVLDRNNFITTEFKDGFTNKYLCFSEGRD